MISNLEKLFHLLYLGEGSAALAVRRHRNGDPHGQMQRPSAATINGRETFPILLGEQEKEAFRYRRS